MNFNVSKSIIELNRLLDVYHSTNTTYVKSPSKKKSYAESNSSNPNLTYNANAIITGHNTSQNSVNHEHPSLENSYNDSNIYIKNHDITFRNNESNSPHHNISSIQPDHS